MTVSAKLNFGQKVFMDAAPTAATTLVAELVSVTLPTATRGTLDATTHDSIAGAMEFLSEGVYDPGEMSLVVKLIDGSATDTAFTTALTSGALQNVKVQIKGATGFRAWSFSGFATSYGPGDMPVTGLQEATFGLKVSGPVTKAAVTP